MLHLFEAFGIELEYMIVSKNNLRVAPIADWLLKQAEKLNQKNNPTKTTLQSIEWPSEVTIGQIGWSNELALHVIEFKTAKPTKNFTQASQGFNQAVQTANQILSTASQPATLLGTSAHPFFDPETEMRLWPHGSNEIYKAYHRIFDCRGHGWSNLQSMHINLPFANDEEFGRLHAAIRVVLPLLSALCSSSPILESKTTNYLDTRLDYYRKNQSIIPSITGFIIPEPVFSMSEYVERILKPMYRDIAPFDPDQTLHGEWLNSRGAIARFDRMAIEIRTMDIQECSAMDLATAGFSIILLQSLCNEEFCSISKLQSITTDSLYQLFIKTMKYGSETIIEDSSILEVFDENQPLSVKELLYKLLDRLSSNFSQLFQSESNHIAELLRFLLEFGSPAQRILQFIESKTGTLQSNQTIDHQLILTLYQRMIECLANNQPFQP